MPINITHPKVHHKIPFSIALFFIVGSVVLTPWTIYLDQSLPTHHLYKHWDIAWVGLDIALIVSLLMTGILAYKKSLWVVFAAVFAGSLLLVDAWFDIMGSHPGFELLQSVAAAVCLEIPLATLTFLLAYRVLHKAYER